MLTESTARRSHTLLAVFLVLSLLYACSDWEQATPTAVGVGSPTAAVAGSTDTKPSAGEPTAAAAESPTAQDDATGEADQKTIVRPAGWSNETHGNDVAPNYAVVFPEDKVNQFTITITPENWAAMQTDMTALFGEPGQGQGGQGGFGGPGGQPGDPPPGGGGQPGGGGRGMDAPNPDWVTATISFAGNTWTDVGVRYKGNSSLTGSWRNGTTKLPFKLDFDQWEDEYPAIKNQRFYGFKQLSLSNNWGDSSFMRETVTYDILEDAGLVAAKTSFYEVLVDHGDGPESMGLYTAIEVIDDTVVDRLFADASGNIYEADGSGASLAAGTEAQLKSSFQKENNEEAADWSDIEALYDALNSPERTTDPATWRGKLEAIFDVDSFLHWLAISATIQHWDTYGNMTHNFYLYDNPATGKLTWISWDHNLVLGASGGFGGGQNGNQNGGRGGPGNRSTSLDKKDVNSTWPLIRYLLDQPAYYDRYVNYLRDTEAGVFNVATLTTKYQTLAAVLKPYADKESDATTFEAAVQDLITRTEARSKAVTDFIAPQ